jgi:hypothetical protein
MAEIINLRKARKVRARETAEQRAVENRFLHGLSKGEKHVLRLENEKQKKKFDGLILK